MSTGIATATTARSPGRRARAGGGAVASDVRASGFGSKLMASAAEGSRAAVHRIPETHFSWPERRRLARRENDEDPVVVEISYQIKRPTPPRRRPDPDPGKRCHRFLFRFNEKPHRARRESGCPAPRRDSPTAENHIDQDHAVAMLDRVGEGRQPARPLAVDRRPSRAPVRVPCPIWLALICTRPVWIA